MRFPAIAILTVMIAAAVAPQQSLAAGSITLSALSAGNIAFTVTDITSNRLAPPTNPAYSFTMNAHTSTSNGSVTLIAPTITGTGGNSISLSAFWASCTATSDPAGMFSSSGVVQLGAAPITCATLASHNNNTVQFTVNLFLDATSDATGFSADTYAIGSLTVTANAP